MTEMKIAEARKSRKGRPQVMEVRGFSRFESDFIPDLGPRSLDGARRQLEDPPGVPEDPGKAVPVEPFVPSHHLPIRTEKERVEFETHPEGMDAVTRPDPEPIPKRKIVRSKKSSQPGEEGICFQDAVRDDDLPGDISRPQQGGASDNVITSCSSCSTAGI